MIKVQFITAGGQRIEAQASAGQRLLEVAQAAGMPLEGTCEGQMACSTCHVLISPDWFSRLKPASADEEDMLDLAAAWPRPAVCPARSRLAPILTG